MSRGLIASAIVALSVHAGAAASHPHLTLMRVSPVTVQGADFASRERVHLVLRGPSGVVDKHTRADGKGSFSARFSVNMDARCSGFSITARGSSGSYARLLRRQPASCTHSP